MSGTASRAFAIVGTRLMSVARCSSISLYTVSGIEAANHHLLHAHHRGGVRVTPSVGVKQRDRVQVHHVVRARHSRWTTDIA